MKLKIITYVDKEKLFEEKYECDFKDEKIREIITYFDKNKNKVKITVDKIIESVSIEKDNVITEFGYSRRKSKYSTNYGVMELESQLVKLDKKERNSFIVYDIIYNLYFGGSDKQQNKLRLQIKK